MFRNFFSIFSSLNCFSGLLFLPFFLLLSLSAGCARMCMGVYMDLCRYAQVWGRAWDAQVWEHEHSKRIRTDKKPLPLQCVRFILVEANVCQKKSCYKIQHYEVSSVVVH